VLSVVMCVFVPSPTSGSFVPARANGLEALGFNPAQLAYPHRPAFSCRVFDFDAGFDNNAFTFGQYNRYTGAYLDNRAKQDILASIPRGGLEVRAGASAAGVEFVTRNLGVTLKTEAAGAARMPQEVFDLALYGNRLNRTYQADADASGQVFARAGGSVASAFGSHFALGVGAYYLRGLYCAELQQAEARLVTTPDAVSSFGTVRYRTATGGAGKAFELGAAFWKDGWFVSAAARDILAAIEWTDGLEYHGHHFTLDEGNAYDIRSRGLFRAESQRGAGPEFVTRLPLRVNVGAARVLNPQVTCGAAVSAGFGSELQSGWRASGLIEVSALSRFVLALEPGYGSPDGPFLGAGLEASLGPMRLRGRFGYLGGAGAAARGARFGLGMSYAPSRPARDTRPYRI